MGADYCAYAVIGCLVDEEKIPMKKTRVKAFKHDFPDNPEVQFHPKTGQQLYEDVEYPAFAFENDSPDVEVIKLEKYGLELFSSTDHHYTVIGVGTGKDTYSNGGDEYDFVKLPDISKIKSKVKEVLEMIGQWDEESFGLYSLLYCSY